MTSPVTVSERDLRTLVHIITDRRTDLPAEGLPSSLLSDLADQIRCDTVAFFGLDSGQQLQPFGQEWPADSGDDDPLVFWQHYLAALLGQRPLQLPRPQRRPAPRDHDLGLLFRQAMAQQRHVHRLLPAVGGRS